MAAAQEVGIQPATRARARDRLRAQLGELASSTPVLTEDDVPMLESAKARRWWIAERLAQGLWRSADVEVLRLAWACSPRTVENYAAWASDHVSIATEDIDRLVDLAATRIAKVADCDDPVLVLKAAELQLKLTGHLKGGAEHHAPSNAELEAQMIQALRDPDDMMTRWLRAAMSDPGEGMRALMAEFSVPVAVGEAIDG